MPESRASSARSRFQPDPRSRLRLTDRDRKLICDVFLHRAMTRLQIQTLFFGSLSRCNLRLRMLYDHGYLARHFPPEAPYGAQAAYTAGKAAAELVARSLEMDETEVIRLCREDPPSYLAHTLAVVEWRLALQKAVAQDDDLTLDLWLPELRCRHAYEMRTPPGRGGPAWREQVFKPDAFFRLALRSTGELRSYFVEIDLGNTSTRRFEEKVQAHEQYLACGLFREMYDGGAFQTLVITTGPLRRRNLLEIARGQRSRLFRFCTWEDVRSDRLLEPVWFEPDRPEPVALAR